MRTQIIRIVRADYGSALEIEGPTRRLQIYSSLEAAIAAGWRRAKRENAEPHIFDRHVLSCSFCSLFHVDYIAQNEPSPACDASVVVHDAELFISYSAPLIPVDFPEDNLVHRSRYARCAFKFVSIWVKESATRLNLLVDMNLGYAYIF